jgi:F0F1-type ATP synthase assembly protein I
MNRWTAALRLTGVGFFIGISIVGGTFAGLWLDGKFNTRPVFILIGLLLGLVVAVFGVYRMIKPLIKNNQDKGNG